MEIFSELASLVARRSSSAFVKHLRKKGWHISKHTHLFSPLTTTVDITKPYLASIGDYCEIPDGAVI